MKPEFKSMVGNKEETSIQPEKQEEKRIKKNEDSISDSRTFPNVPTSES